MCSTTPRRWSLSQYAYAPFCLAFVPLFILNNYGYIASTEIAAPMVLALHLAALAAEAAHADSTLAPAVAFAVVFPDAMVLVALAKHGYASRRGEATAAAGIAIMSVVGACIAADGVGRAGGQVAAVVLLGGVACAAQAAEVAVAGLHDEFGE